MELEDPSRERGRVRGWVAGVGALRVAEALSEGRRQTVPTPKGGTLTSTRVVSSVPSAPSITHDLSCMLAHTDHSDATFEMRFPGCQVVLLN